MVAMEFDLKDANIGNIAAAMLRFVLDPLPPLQAARLCCGAMMVLLNLGYLPVSPEQVLRVIGREDLLETPFDPEDADDDEVGGTLCCSHVPRAALIAILM